MEDLLKINEQDTSFDILFRHNPQPMWIVEVDTLKFLLVNEAAIAHYGYSSEEFASITLEHIRPLEERNSMKSLIRRIKHNQTVKRKLQHLKKDGTLIYVHITSYTIEFRGKKCRMVIINDVTEQHLNDLKMQKTLRQINQTMENITDGFITISNTWKVSYWNKEAENTFNISKEKVLNKNFWKVCKISKNDVLYQQFKHSLEHGAKLKFEFYLSKYDKWLSIAVYPGKKGLTVYFQNITERKKSEEQINLKNKHLREIAFINSHVIRRPIANVIGIVNSLDEETAHHPSISKQVEMIKRSAEELDRIIKEINLLTEDISPVQTFAE